MENSLKNTSIALIGCGDLGNRTAALLLDQQAHVAGFRRQPQHIIEGVNATALDVNDKRSLDCLHQQHFDYVVISLTPDISAKIKDQAAVEAAYRKTYIEGLQNILAALNMASIKKLIWISSTSVYGQDDGSIIDENSPTQPQRTSGKILKEAEALLSSIEDKACIIRFAGIYREGSHRLITQLQQHKLAEKVDRDYYTNRIHVHDCARMISFLLHRDATGFELDRIYIGVDNSPVLYTELAAFLSAKTGLPLNKNIIAKKPAVGSKRCSNVLIRSTGFRFLYADYQSGFSSFI